jgi:hypothetical protein
LRRSPSDSVQIPRGRRKERNASRHSPQLFGTLRHPSATDVTAAVIGAAIGTAWERLARKQG